MVNNNIKISKLLAVATDLIRSRSEEGYFIENSKQFLEGYAMALLDLMSEVTEEDLTDVFKRIDKSNFDLRSFNEV